MLYVQHSYSFLVLKNCQTISENLLNTFTLIRFGFQKLQCLQNGTYTLFWCQKVSRNLTSKTD